MAGTLTPGPRHRPDGQVVALPRSAAPQHLDVGAGPAPSQREVLVSHTLKIVVMAFRPKYISSTVVEAKGPRSNYKRSRRLRHFFCGHTLRPGNRFGCNAIVCNAGLAVYRKASTRAETRALTLHQENHIWPSRLLRASTHLSALTAKTAHTLLPPLRSHFQS